MRQILITFLLFLFANSILFAQVPKLLDQFPSNINTEDLMSRLDSLGSELLKSENSLALVKVNGEKKNLQGFSYRYAEKMKAYLTNNRRINGTKIITQQCNGENEIIVELILVSAKKDIAECEKSLFIPGKTAQFDSYYYSFEYPEFDDCCAIFGADYAGARASLKAFAELLKKSPESRAYIISYNGTNIHWINNKTIRILDSISLGQATAKAAKSILVENGIEDARITIVYGGYKDSTRNIELWFVPKGGEIPKPKPNYFPKKKRNKS